jgi:hypothetical protein
MKTPLFLLVALPAFCVSASADIIDISSVFNVDFGTATFNASQSTGVTAETSIGSGIAPADLSTVLSDLGPGVINQVETDPLVLTATPSFPSFVLSALPGLESANGLGFSYQGVELALPALLNLLETQSTPVVVASDTGPQYFPDPSYVFTYEDIIGPFSSGHTYDVLINVNFYQDNLQLVATPEPSSLALLTALAAVAFVARKRIAQATGTNC